VEKAVCREGGVIPIQLREKIEVRRSSNLSKGETTVIKRVTQQKKKKDKKQKKKKGECGGGGA